MSFPPEDLTPDELVREGYKKPNMSDELRAVLQQAFDFAGMGTDSPADIAAAICDTLGITREMIDSVEDCMAAPKYRSVEQVRCLEALRALREVAGR